MRWSGYDPSLTFGIGIPHQCQGRLLVFVKQTSRRRVY